MTMLNGTTEETKLNNIYQILIFAALCLAAKEKELIFYFIIQHIDTLPKYGKKTLDVRRST